MSTSLKNGFKPKKKRRQTEPAPLQSIKEGTQQPINWHDNVDITDVTVTWLYEAHSVLLLFIVLSVILYCTFNMHGSLQLGLQLVIFLFVAVGCLVFPAGPFQRPHPIFWRLIFSISLLYALFLLLLLSQSPDDARALLRTLFNDNSLGYPLPERSYATDCRLRFDVIWSCCDRFLLAHFLGWALKAAVIRDRTLSWVLSVLWEFIELLTAYFIPNFAECWWDQWILDVALCNAFGIELGLYVARKWHDNDPTRYRRDWLGSGIIDFRTICSKFRRLLGQFTPNTLFPMHWEPTQSIKRYLQINLFVIGAVVVDLNAFLLKLYLYIPTEHPLNVWRLGLMLLFFIVSVKQFYLFITNPKCMKLGSQLWICIVILVLELALSYKCAPDDFPAMPFINKVCLSMAGVLYLVFTYVMFRRVKHVKTN